MAKKRKRSKKWIYWLFILVLLIAAGVVSYLVWDNYFNDKKDSEETSEVKEQEEQKPQEEDTSGDGELASETVEKEKVPQYDGEDPNKAESLSGVVTYAGVSGGNLAIRVNIDQYLTSGKCELTLQRGGATIYSSIASIVGSASTATCEGFDVPVAELGGGKVEININLSAEERSGVIRGEVDI